MATAAHAEQRSMDGAGRTMCWQMGARILFRCSERPAACSLQPALGVPADVSVVWILEEEVQGEGEDGRRAIAAPITQKVFWRMGFIWVVAVKSAQSVSLWRGEGAGGIKTTVTLYPETPRLQGQSAAIKAAFITTATFCDGPRKCWIDPANTLKHAEYLFFLISLCTCLNIIVFHCWAGFVSKDFCTLCLFFFLLGRGLLFVLFMLLLNPSWQFYVILRLRTVKPICFPSYFQAGYSLLPDWYDLWPVSCVNKQLSVQAFVEKLEVKPASDTPLLPTSRPPRGIANLQYLKSLQKPKTRRSFRDSWIRVRKNDAASGYCVFYVLTYNSGWAAVTPFYFLWNYLEQTGVALLGFKLAG